MELRSNWKAKQRPKYLDAIRRIQDCGITVNGCFVLGLDSHTPASFERIWEFIQQSGLYEVQLTVLTPFPGTPLYARLEQEGRLIEPMAWEKRTLFDIVYRPSQLTVEELHTGLITLAQKVYSADFTKQRRHAFIRRKLGRDQATAAVLVEN